jgi:uncharacterized protein (DUF433 family)
MDDDIRTRAFLDAADLDRFEADTRESAFWPKTMILRLIAEIRSMRYTSRQPAEIVCDPDILGGEPTIAGTRIGVHHIVSAWRHNQGDMARMWEDFPHLSPDQVRAAFAYNHAHRQEIAAILRRDQEFYERGLAAQQERANDD